MRFSVADLTDAVGAADLAFAVIFIAPGIPFVLILADVALQSFGIDNRPAGKFLIHNAMEKCGFYVGFRRLFNGVLQMPELISVSVDSFEDLRKVLRRNDSVVIIQSSFPPSVCILPG